MEARCARIDLIRSQLNFGVRLAHGSRLTHSCVTLPALVDLLRQYLAGEVTLETVHAYLLPVLTADSLHVAESDSTAWDTDHQSERLFWRLVYVVEAEPADGAGLVAPLQRILGCLDTTRSAASTFELLPLLLDQPRFCSIVRKHEAGPISRTGFLSAIAESGYPEHIKLWLQHASSDALAVLCSRLESGLYDLAAAAFEAPPA